MTSNFIDCCFAKQRRPDLICDAAENPFSDCDALLRRTAIRFLIWFMLAFTLIGNLAVFVSRFFVEDSSISQKLFITSLGVSDLLMGIYLTIVASKDQLWRGNYFKHDEEWRTSISCLVAGLLSMTSSQASLLTLIAITYDRYRSITKAMTFIKIGFRMAVLIVVLIWWKACGLSVYPIISRIYLKSEEEDSRPVCGTNTVCLPLELRGNEATGWEYSFALFGVVNLVMSCYMVVAYIWMFVSVKKTSKRVKSENMKKETALAKRMLCIVLTDLMCWFPVILVLFLSFFKLFHDPHREIFAWLAVCAIPINSALNPLLYTLTTPRVVNAIYKFVGRKEVSASGKTTGTGTGSRQRIIGQRMLSSQTHTPKFKMNETKGL